MRATDYLEELKTKGVTLWLEGSALRYRAPKEIVAELREELAKRKPELVALLRHQTDQSCHHCGTRIRLTERENYFELECENDPLHYSEIKRKPEADRLWSDVPLPNEIDDQQILFS